MEAGSPVSSQSELLVYLNGRIIPRSQATLDIEDRATVFGDGVYEVIRNYRGRFFGMDEHWARLRRGLAALEIPESDEVKRLPEASTELMRRCELPEGKIYWQVSRGVAPREHAYSRTMRPTVFALPFRMQRFEFPPVPPQVRAICLPDERWMHCNIKTVMLLPNVLARQKANQAGAAEAILHRNQIITEGAVTNAFMVRDGQLFTHPANHLILPGVTRGFVLELACAAKIVAHEKSFTLDELRAADEVFITGTTTHVTAVTDLDGRPVGAGDIGPVTRKLHEALTQSILRACGGE